MLTEQESNDMHAMVTEMEDRGLAGDLYTMSRLAEATGDTWENLVRELLAQWQQGRSAVDCRAHNPEVAGSNPAPASSPQAPIARLQVHPSGALAVSLYAPGLPPGEHDLYCDPDAPSFNDMRRALELLRPFVEEDFPHGPDGPACATLGYRAAYAAMLKALG